MNEQFVKQGSMWVLAGLGAGWLAETFVPRRGYGLITDLGVGVGARLIGGSAFGAPFGLPACMLDMVLLRLRMPASGSVGEAVGWSAVPGAAERRAGLRLDELRGSSFGVVGTPSGPPSDVDDRPARPRPDRAMVRMASTGIYLLRGVSRDLQRTARSRATRDGTTLRQVLLKGLGEYAAGTWTPAPDVARPVPLNPGVLPGKVAR